MPTARRIRTALARSEELTKSNRITVKRKRNQCARVGLVVLTASFLQRERLLTRLTVKFTLINQFACCNRRGKPK